MIRSLITLALVQLAQAAFFTYNEDVQCDSVLSALDAEVDCYDGSDKCSLYEDTTISGMFLSSSDLPENLCLDMRFCYLGINFGSFCTTYSTSVDTCGDLNMSPLGDNYAACPSAGRYQFSTPFSLPLEYEETDRYTNAWGVGGWWIKVFTTISDCDGTTIPDIKCTHTLSATRNQHNDVASSTLDYYEMYQAQEKESGDGQEEESGDDEDDVDNANAMAGAAVLILAAASALAIRKRKNQESTPDEFRAMEEEAAVAA